MNKKMVAAKYLGTVFLFCALTAIAIKAAPGDLDPTFGIGGKVIDGSGYGSYDVAIQPDGKIVSVGISLGGSEGTQIAVARYNIDGSPDTTFDGTGRVLIDRYGVAMDVAIQPDGKIVVASRNNDGEVYGEILRLNSDGSLDTSFGTNGIVAPLFLPSIAATLPDGKLLIDLAARLFRLNANGSFDSTFSQCQPGVGTSHYLYNRSESVIQADGKILTAFTSGGSSGFGVFRCNTNGTLDTTFGSGGVIITPINGLAVAQSIALQTDGKVIVAGQSQTTDWKLTLARYNPNGSLDTTFGAGGIVTSLATHITYWNPPIGSVSVQTDGKIVASDTILNGSGDFALVRVNPNGSLDNTFGGGDGITTVDFNTSYDDAHAMAIDRQGRAVLVGGADGMVAIARLILASPAAAFDFDGDGRSDISIFRPSNGQWWYVRSSDGESGAAQFSQSTDIPVPGDYTGDGKTDIAHFRPSTGEWFILRSEDGSYFSYPFGLTGDIPAPADYDGDGITDTATFRPSTATWYIFQSGSGTYAILTFGLDGDRPVPADYDGDGKADVSVWRPSNGQWWMLWSSDLSGHGFQFGTSTDKPVPGDYTGDGKADIAVWRDATREWYFLRSEDGSYYSYPSGLPGDIPAPGDYDGDGKHDSAVFRPSTQTWYIDGSTAGSMITTFGLNGDRPVANAYVP